jgi:hypothetical protein
MPFRFSLSACAISDVRFLGYVLVLVWCLADYARLGLAAEAFAELLSNSYFDFSAKLSGVRPSLLVIIGLAPCSNKYFTIS